MKRILLFLIVGAVAAFAALYAIRYAGKASAPSVAALLPIETIAFAHLPDFNRTRAEWHQSDIYQLYAEPSVQEFLRKPLAKLPAKNSTAQTMGELERLAPQDVFAAITRIDNNNPTMVGGFRYRGSNAEAEKVIERWRANLVASRGAQREKIKYEQHEIDSITVAPFVLVAAFDGDWFFAANDLAALKALLNRADHRGQDRPSTLEADQHFQTAISRMPANYAVAFYLQPKVFADKLAWLRAADGRSISPDQRTTLEQMRSICGASRFDHGKISDTLFVAMPRLQDAKLTRSSLALGTKETFLYLTTLLNLGQKVDALSQAAGGNALAAGWQKALQGLERNGVTAEDWKAAFGVEATALGDWPATAKWPWLFVSFPVQDPTRAPKIVEAITRVDEDSTWTRTEKDHVSYYSMVSPASFFALSPTIALSNRMMLIGIDPVSVEQRIKRGDSGSSELADSAAYSNAAKSVGTPTNFFAYVDLPLLYTRLDAALRPMLFLSAAFLPSLNEYVDVSKLPPAEVVTKHLSPIVSAQRYEGDGYLAESVGSITLNQSGAAIGALAVLGSMAYQRGAASTLSPLIAPPAPGQSASQSPAVRPPSATPRPTP